MFNWIIFCRDYFILTWINCRLNPRSKIFVILLRSDAVKHAPHARSLKRQYSDEKVSLKLFHVLEHFSEIAENLLKLYWK